MNFDVGWVEQSETKLQEDLVSLGKALPQPKRVLFLSSES